MRVDVRTDPAVIREVLDYADTFGAYAAAKRFEIHYRTIDRWRRRRNETTPDWPTPEYVTAWRLRRATAAPAAARSNAYAKRVYANGGARLQRPAIGTTRRLQSLMALGWTLAEIGDLMGVRAARVGHLMSGKYPTVFPATATSVDKAFRALCMTVPQDPDPLPYRATPVHARNRRLAAKRGYAPPLAWDNIDDPNEVPDVPSPRSGPARAFGRPDHLRDLLDQGAGLQRACSQIGLSRNSLFNWCRYNGLKDVYEALARNDSEVA